MRSHTSGSEVERRTSSAALPSSRTASRREPSNPVTSPRSSTKEKKQRRHAPAAPRYSCVLGVRELMGVLAVVGPLGRWAPLSRFGSCRRPRSWTGCRSR